MLHTITNADGTLSIIHMDPNNSIITLPDGTTAQVQGVAVSLNFFTFNMRITTKLSLLLLLPLSTQLATQGEGGTTTIQTVQGMDGQTENMTVDLSEAGLGQENQLIITGEDGHGYPVSVSGMITVPMSSMYQMVANIQHLHQNGDGTVCLTPIQVSNAGGSIVAPNTKYHMLRAAAPLHTIKYEMQQRGDEGLAVTGKVGTGICSSSSSSNNSSNSHNNNGSGGPQQMSSGLASLIDVIQLQLKGEVEIANDCNNNGRGDGENEEGEDEEDSGGGGDNQRTKLEFVREGEKRIVVQLKQN